jgi:hypothetical protein
VSWWTVAGSSCLGLVTGWLVREFVTRTKRLELKAILSLTTLLSSGAVLAVWRSTKDAPIPEEASSFFVGVFVSVLVLGLLRYSPE